MRGREALKETEKAAAACLQQHGILGTVSLGHTKLVVDLGIDLRKRVTIRNRRRLMYLESAGKEGSNPRQLA